MLVAYDLRTEHMSNPIGIDAARPRLGWKLQSDRQHVWQSAYRIQAAPDPDFSQLLWDSGRVESDQSQHVPYGGPPLSSTERVYWRVKVWDDQEESQFSEPAYFEMGLLSVSDWQARWIEPEGEVDPDAFKPAPYLRREFEVRPGLVSARAYMTAHGLYRCYINGLEVTDTVLNPGCTSYHKRLQYQAYDVTSLLRTGTNAWGVILGDGWWRGSTGAASLRNNWGYRLAYLGQIVLRYADGSVEVVCTDGTFRTTTGPILKSDLKAGEVYDARLTLDGWDLPGYDDSGWRPVKEVDLGLDNLIANRSLPVRRRERFSPKVLRTPNGEIVLDFGQNIAGWVEMQLEGPPGVEVVLVHGEVLDSEGNFTLQNLAFMGQIQDFQEVHYITRGGEPETYSPHFSIFGFRYVLLRNYPGEVSPENFLAVAVYSDLEETGDFRCANELINQLVSNTRWSQKGNFVDIPTDCPTRERAGWTGDAQVYCKTSTYFMHVLPFFEKWLADLEAEQFSSGCVPSTVPNVSILHNPEEWERLSSRVPEEMFELMPRPRPGEPSPIDGSAGWGDAATIVPWTLYLCYGDRTILERQYASAKAWVDYMDTCARRPNQHYSDHPAYHNRVNGELDARYIWDTGFHWGEWLEADLPMPDDPEVIKTFWQERAKYADPLVATAYYAYSSRLLAEMARVLGREDDHRRYAALWESIRRVYDRYFVRDDGWIQDMRGEVLRDRQAPYVRVLALGLASEAHSPAVADRLVQIIRDKDYHLNTGFLSTPFLLWVLHEHGYTDVAFRLLEQTTPPSWLYAVTKGATTIWETWWGIDQEGNPRGSHNHYSYGAVCDFLFGGLAGIQPISAHPGYKHFILSPIVGGSLAWVSAEYHSIYGTIESSWRREGNGVRYRFVVPPNTRATIKLAGDEEAMARAASQLDHIRYEDGHLVAEVGSGTYELQL